MLEPKKSILKLVVKELRLFNFDGFNPITDKQKLFLTLQNINSKLGKLLKEIENAAS
jgi:hypothetical protein